VTGAGQTGQVAGRHRTAGLRTIYSLAVPTLRWVQSTTSSDIAEALDQLRVTLGAAGLAPSKPGTGTGGVLLVWADRPLDAGQLAEVRSARERGAVLALLGPTLQRADADGLNADGGLAGAAGLLPGSVTPEHDVRVRPGPDAVAAAITDHGHAGLGHLGEHVHSRDRVLRIDKVHDDVQVLLTANVGLVEHPMATWRPSTRVLAWTLGGTREALTSRSFARLLVAALRRVLGVEPAPAVRIGLLGYGAIGHEHARAATAVEGLELTAVCDTAAHRRDAAVEFTPGVRTHEDPASLVADDLDLIVVSTPPASHAEWALRTVESGRHVIVEKPFAVTTDEADAVLAAAAERDLLAVVYQNRRFDPDHLALRRLAQDGVLGELFHLEAFVGGYGHPCNLWHSDEAVSGGAFYDWGAHVIDQLLDLLPGTVEQVSAVTHKRRWFDVTNADHSRVTIRMAGGAEAEFVYSDLAAALKPRWYVLGTEGAVVGRWRTERVVARSAVGTLAEDVLAPADSPPVMEHHHGDGSVTRLALLQEAPHPFHVELADYLRLGLPMSVTGEQSRRVLSVMEAARASAADHGRWVQPR
jgi:scyllo-inositol 2-dehydrogenase (NADP+)